VRPKFRRLCRFVIPVVAACSVAASVATPAGAAARPGASTARLDAKGLQLVDTYLQRSRGANTRAETVGANATAKRIFKHVRGASARYDKRSIDTIATYVVRAGMPELQANLGSSLTVYNDALGFVTKSNLFELMKLSPDVLHRIRDGGTTIHVGDRPITTMAGMGGLAGTTVRGHEAGARWEDIGGAYNLTDNVVAAGRGNASYERYVGTILHELGHAYDAKTKLSSSPEFRSLHQRFGRYADPYFAQAEDAGPQEYFADLCRAYWTGGTAEVNARFGRETAAWMKQTVPR
jgi:hypothetical protein